MQYLHSKLCIALPTRDYRKEREVKERKVTEKSISAFAAMLKEEERSTGTVEKYLRDVRALSVWLAGRPITKELTAQWKRELLQQSYAPTTVNSMVSAVHRFFRFMGWPECRVKFLRIQRRTLRENNKELTRADYQRLLEAAQKSKRKCIGLLMETICATGIRVSEVRAITIAAAEQGCAEISLKGKIRTILLPGKLCKKLIRYAKKEKITSGEIFRAQDGKSLSRQKIWWEMKVIAKIAGVQGSKVFPHNLRHLFARMFYRLNRDIVQLADLLGHSSVNTTRIYLMTTGADHLRQLERLGLIT